VGDTLVKEEVPEPSENYVGVGKVVNTERFCSVAIDENGKVFRIDDKVKCDNPYAFIFAIGVKDYKTMFDALEKDQNLIQGEIQLSNGLKALMEKGLSTKKFMWFDTGTPESYAYAMENFPDGKGDRGEY
jgi:dTDP-glucose pyrophosphorylase